MRFGPLKKTKTIPKKFKLIFFKKILGLGGVGGRSGKTERGDSEEEPQKQKSTTKGVGDGRTGCNNFRLPGRWN